MAGVELNLGYLGEVAGNGMMYVGPLDGRFAIVHLYDFRGEYSPAYQSFPAGSDRVQINGFRYDVLEVTNNSVTLEFCDQFGGI